MHTETFCVALFDAHPEHAHFESPFVLSRARALGTALGEAGLGIVARPSTMAMTTALASHRDTGAFSILLSPAANREEHEQAFRLPAGESPILFTGRGALGADMTAFFSGHALIVMGSCPTALENILQSVKVARIPVGILTDEAPSDLHARIRAFDASLAPHIFVSHDPAVLAREVRDEVRRRSLAKAQKI